MLATTVMTYTHSGWKLGMNDPDMGIWSYEYLGNGLMDVQTDARGCQIEFTYDKHSRIKTKEYSGPQGETCAGTDEVTYTYDDTSNGNEGLGLRTGMDDASGVTSWLYDTRGRVLTETRVLTDNLGTFVTGWTYNSANQVVTMQYPGGPGGQLGEIVTFGYWS